MNCRDYVQRLSRLWVEVVTYYQNGAFEAGLRTDK